jgi:ATP-dependent Lhr-like helicase
VEEAAGRPNIPTWSSERLPLSFDTGRSILSFNRDMLWMMKSRNTKGEVECKDGEEDRGGRAVVSWLLQQYPIDRNSARCICEIFSQQIAYLGEDAVPTDRRIVVEECQDREAGRRDFYFHSGYGLRFNEGLARMLAYLLARQRAGEIRISTADSGFVLSLPQAGRVNLQAAISSIREENCEQLLYRAVQNTSLLKSVFRINATRSFLILKSYKGRRRSARHQQFDADMLIGFAGRLDDFAVLRESYREIIEDRFEVENIKEVLRALAGGEIEVVIKQTASPSPMAFGLAAADAAEEKRERMREMERRVTERIREVQKDNLPNLFK